MLATFYQIDIRTWDNKSVLLSPLYCSHAYNCIAVLTYIKCNVKVNKLVLKPKF